MHHAKSVAELKPITTFEGNLSFIINWMEHFMLSFLGLELTCLSSPVTATKWHCNYIGMWEERFSALVRNSTWNPGVGSRWLGLLKGVFLNHESVSASEALHG